MKLQKMAFKSALNMMTHTASEDLARDGACMNAVDTGESRMKTARSFLNSSKKCMTFSLHGLRRWGGTGLRSFFDGILTGKHRCGKFFKDYFPIEW